MRDRVRVPERLDDPKLPPDDCRAALAGLARLNRVSGISRLMFPYIRRLAKNQPNQKLRLLDVASGSGDVPISWMRRARLEGWNLQVTLLERRSLAIEEQQRRAHKYRLDVLSLQQDCLESPLPGGHDLVTCSLFFHHLDVHQSFRLLQSMQAASNGGLLISDLERSRMNLLMVSTAAAILSRSSVVRHDAAASVRAAYRIDEFKTLSSEALSHSLRFIRVFPCRFIAYQDEVTIKDVVPAFA